MKVLAQFKLNYIKIIYCSLTSIVFEIDEAVIFSKTPSMMIVLSSGQCLEV